jgi:hypothetical protein
MCLLVALYCVFCIHLIFPDSCEMLLKNYQTFWQRKCTYSQTCSEVTRICNTDKKYSSAFLRFHKWDMSRLGSKDTLLAKSLTVALYLACLNQTAKTPSHVIAAFYAIKWYHEQSDLRSPTRAFRYWHINQCFQQIVGR